LSLEKLREESLKTWLQKNNFNFSDLELFDLALTHSSSQRDDNKNNERLAFLGDAVLSLFFAEMLYIKFPDKEKGSLTDMRKEKVNREFLAEIGMSKKIEDIIQMRGVRNDGLQTVIGEAIEAVIGAFFLDKGWKDTKRLLKSLFEGK
jgi:ribonuclease-3